MNITKNKIFFFDMDNTLIYTNEANFMAYKKAIECVISPRYVINYPKTRFTRELLKKAIPDLTCDKYLEIIQKKKEYYNNFLCTTTVNKEIAEVVYTYFNTNILVLLTNSSQKRAIITLDYHNLTGKFDHIFCKESKIENKVANKFENALLELNISPNLIIAFDDEEKEIEDARKAGILFVNPTIDIKNNLILT